MRRGLRIPETGWFVLNAAILYACFNPSNVSLLALVKSGDLPMPLRLLVLLAGAVPLGMLLAATIRSIGLLGIAVLAGVWGLLIWAASGLAWINLWSGTLWLWVLPLILSVTLTIGQRFANWRRIWTGQVVVDGD